MTYQEIYREACELLENAGIVDARTDAWILLEYVTGVSRTLFYVEPGRELADDAAQEYKRLLAQRVKRIPVQHLTGEQEFMGMTFQVNPSVLVPRQDTEVLVELAEKVLRPGMRVLDMCTGSGCILISLEHYRKGIRAVGADISDEALQVAKRNAESLNADVTFLKSDLFEQVAERYDLIVSNPPYIRTKAIEELEEEVRLHDPMIALDGKEDGLYFYRKITEKSREHLKQGGWLLFEIGYDQGEDVAKMMEKAGFTEVTVKKDLAGLDRVVSGMYNR